MSEVVLPHLLQVEIFLAVAVLLTGLGAVIAALRQRSVTSQLQRRIERARSNTQPDAARHRPSPSATVRRQQRQNLFGRVGDSLASFIPRAAALRARLDEADLPISLTHYVAGAFAVGAVSSSLLWVFFHLPIYVLLSQALMTAIMVPHILLARRIATRQSKFLGQFPDALDLIVRGVKSGLPVNEALYAVSQEIPDPTGKLFGEVTGNLTLGMTLDEALNIAAARIRLQEFRFFIVSLAIQQETGGNLGEILDNLSQVMRRRQQIRLKIKAMSSEAKSSAFIIGMLPFVTGGIIFAINPDYILKLFQDTRGLFMLGCGMASLLLGVAIMAKMVRFEI